MKIRLFQWGNNHIFFTVLIFCSGFLYHIIELWKKKCTRSIKISVQYLALLMHCVRLWEQYTPLTVSHNTRVFLCCHCTNRGQWWSMLSFKMSTIVIESLLEPCTEFHICINLQYVNCMDWCSAFDSSLFYHLDSVVLREPTWCLRRQHEHTVDPMPLLPYWSPKVFTWCLSHETVEKTDIDMILGGCGQWWKTRRTLSCTLHQLPRETWWETSWVMYFTNSADSIYLSYILEKKSFISKEHWGASQIIWKII